MESNEAGDNQLGLDAENTSAKVFVFINVNTYLFYLSKYSGVLKMKNAVL